MRYRGVVIRPPSEAYSYILQVTYGCSHNACTFCATYKGCRYRPREMDEVLEDIEMAASLRPATKRVFLADGNALARDTGELLLVLGRLKEAFPRLERVGIYANASDLLGKTGQELERLRRAGLGIFYLGLESGDDEVLERVKKGAGSREMIEAVQRGRKAGMQASVIVLLGLGGREGSSRHARRTAEVVSRMQPEYLSSLTLMVIPGTPLHRQMVEGGFELPDPLEMLAELREMISGIEVPSTLFRSNHASNYLPLGGLLSRDRDNIIRNIDRAYKDPGLLRPEHHRGL